jgi:hypothetical protein
MMVDLDKLTKIDKRLGMWCECCGELFVRWDIEMVEPEDCVFEINEIYKAKGKDLAEFNFACPQCVTELSLTPLQTVDAKRWRKNNVEIRELMAPTLITH